MYLTGDMPLVLRLPGFGPNPALTKGDLLFRSRVGGAPVAGVQVTVSDIPNKVGGVYSVSQWTGTDGSVTIDYVDAGLRRVSISVPAGFSPDPQGIERQVEVIRRQSVTTAFRITRQATS